VPSGERLRRKGRHSVFVGKTVLSMPERFEIYTVYKRRYINTLPFLFFLMGGKGGGWDCTPRAKSDIYDCFVALPVLDTLAVHFSNYS